MFRCGASAESVRSLENELGLGLPDDLVEFFLLCDAIIAMSVWNGYWIGDLKKITIPAFRDFFPTTVDGSSGPEPTIPIATDGGGNAFLVSLTNGSVWSWPRETGAVSIIARSFKHFLERVVADWEHAIINDGNWKYLV